MAFPNRNQQLNYGLPPEENYSVQMDAVINSDGLGNYALAVAPALPNGQFTSTTVFENKTATQDPVSGTWYLNIVYECASITIVNIGENSFVLNDTITIFPTQSLTVAAPFGAIEVVNWNMAASGEFTITTIVQYYGTV